MIIPDFKLERYFAKWEFAAPYLLCASDVQGYRMADLLALADDDCRALWNDLTLGYTEASGHPLLRAEIAGLYEGVAPDEILTFAGAEEAIFALMNVALRPGDHALVMWPGYQSLYEIARSVGAEVTLLSIDHESGWQLDLDTVRRALRPNTRLITVNFPHNPTGTLIDQASFAELVTLADEAGITLFSDEVYRGIEYDPTDRLPAAVSLSRRAVSLGVMSKSFALAGLRIGWLATQDAELLRRAASFKDYLSITNSAPSEILALIALRAKETILARSLNLIQSNLIHVDRFFAEYGDQFEWVRPKAGSIGFPRLCADLPIEQFAAKLVEDQGVLILPGAVYDHPGNHFRLGLGRTNLPEALERLQIFVEKRLKP